MAGSGGTEACLHALADWRARLSPSRFDFGHACSPSLLLRGHSVPAGAHVGVALLPPPDISKSKQKKASNSSSSISTAKAAIKGKGEAGPAVAPASGSAAAAPRGLPGSQLQARQQPATAGDVVAADPAAPPAVTHNRPGTQMLDKMRAQGRTGELS